MKEKWPLLIIALLMLFGGYTKAKNKWQIDSSRQVIYLNTGYCAPLLHLGCHVGIEVPLRTKTKSFYTFSFLSHFGLERFAKGRTLTQQTVFEPQVFAYNHRFNHAAISPGFALYKRLISQTGFLASIGVEYARKIQFYRDVFVIDDRNQISHKALTTNSFNQLGLMFELGYRLSKKKNAAVYYRFHPGILFPYNHFIGLSLQSELGLRIINLN